MYLPQRKKPAKRGNHASNHFNQETRLAQKPRKDSGPKSKKKHYSQKDHEKTQ
jgi:hypothetical protein